MPRERRETSRTIWISLKMASCPARIAGESLFPRQISLLTSSLTIVANGEGSRNYGGRSQLQVTRLWRRAQFCKRKKRLGKTLCGGTGFPSDLRSRGSVA